MLLDRRMVVMSMRMIGLLVPVLMLGDVRMRVSTRKPRDSAQPGTRCRCFVVMRHVSRCPTTGCSMLCNWRDRIVEAIRSAAVSSRGDLAVGICAVRTVDIE
jgi:hypothetical protein